MTTKRAAESLQPLAPTGPMPGSVAALALLDEPTRRRLYDFVAASDHEVGRDETAGELAISRELASFHLDRLAAGGLLQTSYRRLSGRTGPGAGRPAKLYTRADREISVSLPMRRYDAVADVFAKGLEKLAEEVGQETVAGAVSRAARDAGRKFAAGIREGATGRRRGRRRQQLVETLSAGGFEPAVDTSSGVVTLGNCPYRTVADDHRAFTCGMNLAWAEGVTEVVAEAGLTPVLDPQPGRCCVVFSPDS